MINKIHRLLLLFLPLVFSSALALGSDRWKDPTGKWLATCSILTTSPNAVTLPVHDRMSVILDPDSYDLWLDPGMTNVAAASELLKPHDARRCAAIP